MVYYIDEAESRRISELDDAGMFKSSDSFVFSRYHIPDGVDPVLSAVISDERHYGGFLRYLSERVVNDPSFSKEDAEAVLREIQQNSYRITYGRLSAQLMPEISSRLHLSSMAFCWKKDYSTIGHEHQYSKIQIRPIIEKSPSSVCVGSLSSYSGSGRLVDRVSVYVPVFQPPTYYTQEIGETRFMSAPNRHQPAYTAANFDGWVYPDGASYPKSEFPEAYQLYRNTPNSTLTSFCVPVISGFFAANDGSVSENALSVVGWENAVVKHTHAGFDETQLSAQKFKTIKHNIAFPAFYTSSASGGDKSLHTGYTKRGKDLQHSVEINVSNINTLSAETEITTSETESYPAYKNMPLMIYIGIPLSRRTS